MIRLRDAGLGGSRDPAVLDWAADEDRILITHDRQTVPGFAYARLAAFKSMPGVIVVDDDISIAAAIEDLLLIVSCMTPAEVDSQVLYVPV